MSQPNTTSQKPKPPSTAEKNLSRCRYLPRSTPSMSAAATLTLPTGALRTASSTLASGVAFAMGCSVECGPRPPLGSARLRDVAAAQVGAGLVDAGGAVHEAALAQLARALENRIRGRAEERVDAPHVADDVQVQRAGLDRLQRLAREPVEVRVVV